MAGKEATLVLLQKDVGASMYERYESASNEKTRRLDISVDCLKLMLQNKIFNHKTHEVGLILFGCEESEDQTLYIQEIKKPDLDFVRNVGELGEHEVPTRVGGDIFDALDKAVNQIDEYVGTKKYDKKIFILTTGCGESNYKEKELQKLVKMIKRVNVKINIIAIDFLDDYDPEKDDPSELEKYQQQKNIIFAGSARQTPIQNQNQRMLYQMQEELRGFMRIFPAQIAFELYSQFRTKQVSARASFRGEFQINSESSIQVLIYKKTTEDKLPSLKKFSTLAPYNSDVGTNDVKNDSVFYIQDDPNMTPVDKENMIKGYQYGKQIVPIDSIMEEKMKYKCPRSFSLLGFVERHQVPRYYLMSGVDMVVPVDSERAKKQMSALITALIATKKVALARFVGRDKGAPRLMVLLPHKNENYECFWMVALPTVEDIRNFQFSSLKRSTPQQQTAVAALIDAMDLTHIPNDEGEPREILKMKHVVNPTRQYFQQVVMHKAITQTDQIPPISNVILSYLRPEGEVTQYAREEMNKVKQIFKFKKNEIKKQGEKKVFWKQLFEQDQGDEVQEIDQMTEEVQDMVAKQKFGFDKADDIVKEIRSINPLEDFRKMIQEKRADLVESALSQIQLVIKRLVEESVQGSFHQKALECLKDMRKACISEDEPDQFNNFLQHLKDRYQAGPQELFWAHIVKEGITLVSFLENKTSKVSVEQATQVLSIINHQQSSCTRQTFKPNNSLINCKTRKKTYQLRLSDILKQKTKQSVMDSRKKIFTQNLANSQGQQLQVPCHYHPTYSITNFDKKSLMPLCPNCIKQHIQTAQQQNQQPEIESIVQVHLETQQMLTKQYQSLAEALNRIHDFRDIKHDAHSTLHDQLAHAKQKAQRVLDAFFEQLEMELKQVTEQDKSSIDLQLAQAEKFMTNKLNELKNYEDKILGPKFLKYMVRLHGSHYILENEQYIQECHEYIEELAKKTLEVGVEDSKLYNLNLDLAKYVQLKNADYYLQERPKQQDFNNPYSDASVFGNLDHIARTRLMAPQGDRFKQDIQRSKLPLSSEPDNSSGMFKVPQQQTDIGKTKTFTSPTAYNPKTQQK